MAIFNKKSIAYSFRKEIWRMCEFKQKHAIEIDMSISVRVTISQTQAQVWISTVQVTIRDANK